MTDVQVNAPDVEARRALVLHDRPLVVDLIQLTLNHGLFVVRAARSLAEADAILAEWRPDMTVVDMDHDDSTALLGRLGASNSLTRSVTPVLGLTRRGDLKTKLRTFDLGVDDILTMPFSPEELEHRGAVVVVHVDHGHVRDPVLEDRLRLGEAARGPDGEHAVVQRQRDEVDDQRPIVEHERATRLDNSCVHMASDHGSSSLRPGMAQLSHSHEPRSCERCTNATLPSWSEVPVITAMNRWPPLVDQRRPTRRSTSR